MAMTTAAASPSSFVFCAGTGGFLNNDSIAVRESNKSVVLRFIDELINKGTAFAGCPSRLSMHAY